MRNSEKPSYGKRNITQRQYRKVLGKNMAASWLGNTEKQNGKANEQEQENITVLELKAALNKYQK